MLDGAERADESPALRRLLRAIGKRPDWGCGHAWGCWNRIMFPDGSRRAHSLTLLAPRRDRFLISDRFRPYLDYAGRNDRGRRVVARPIGAGRLADQLGEPGAERAERRTADREASIGDRHVPAPQQRLGPFDPARHQVAVRALAEGRLEAPGEVTRRHRRRAGKGRHIERPVKLAIHAVLGLAQPYKVADVHGNAINGTQRTACDRSRLKKPLRSLVLSMDLIR